MLEVDEEALVVAFMLVTHCESHQLKNNEEQSQPHRLPARSGSPEAEGPQFSGLYIIKKLLKPFSVGKKWENKENPESWKSLPTPLVERISFSTLC